MNTDSAKLFTGGTIWTGRGDTDALLIDAAVPDRPVVLRAWDYHTASWSTTPTWADSPSWA